MKEFKLCYIDEKNKAYFTDTFEHQWGDDFNDSPYECNAGTPYTHWSELIEDNEDRTKRKYKEHPIKLKTLFFETNTWTERKPCDMGRFSVEEINKGVVAWLVTDDYCIQAGTTMEEFIKIIEEHKGTIYLAKEKENEN